MKRLRGKVACYTKYQKQIALDIGAGLARVLCPPSEWRGSSLVERKTGELRMIEWTWFDENEGIIAWESAGASTPKIEQ